MGDAFDTRPIKSVVAVSASGQVPGVDTPGFVSAISSLTETAIVPGIYDPDLPDGQIDVATEDAHHMALRLAREEGILVGVSSGGNLHAAMRVASELKEGVVVTIFCDSAAKYLSESFWRESLTNNDAEIWP